MAGATDGMARQPTLEGLNVLVTGANRGVGRAFVDVALAQGAAKVYAAARDVAALAPLVEAHGDRVTPLRLDVTRPADIAAAVSAAQDLDLLINNAGVTPPANFFEIDEQDVRDLIEVNFWGPVALTRAFAAVLSARRGGIIYILSVGALTPGARAPVYHGTKAATAMMALSVRDELARMGISICLVYPGPVATRMTDRHPTIAKADPRDVARETFEGWLAGEVAVFPDPASKDLRERLAQAYVPGGPPDPSRIGRSSTAPQSND